MSSQSLEAIWKAGAGARWSALSDACAMKIKVDELALGGGANGKSGGIEALRMGGTRLWFDGWMVLLQRSNPCGVC